MTKNCQICTETFNKTLRAKVECPYGNCAFESCKTCIRTYLLNTTTDPHCMKCRQAWNHKFLVENLNHSFVDGEYKKHRKQMLLELELSRMPDSMDAAQRQNRIDKEMLKVREQYKICAELRKKLREETIKLRELRTNIHRIRNGNNTTEDTERRKFIMPCPSDNCHGYLSTQYKCDLCSMFTCPDCFELIGLTKTDEHTCNEDSVKSAEMIKKDTKACPNCGIRIHKIIGCNQMWCVGCKTAFNWNTLQIDKGPVHNPHFYQWQATLNNGTAPRNPGDVACGGLIQYSQLINIVNSIKSYYSFQQEKENQISSPSLPITKYNNLHRMVSHITYNDLPQIRNAIHNMQDNESLRVKYILNQSTKDRLFDEIYRRDNVRHRNSELLHVYELLSVVGIETFANIMTVWNENKIFQSMINVMRGGKLLCNRVTKLDMDKIKTGVKQIETYIDEFDRLRVYCNGLLAELSVIHNMAVMQMDANFSILHKKEKFTKSQYRSIMEKNLMSKDVAGSSSDHAKS